MGVAVSALLPPSVSPFVLTHLDVYDWGAFSGRHCAEIDSQGTAIIGPTGSGKTTLVDALMTLLTTSPRYNLASTGGHESDRDLVSYIRGVSGAGNNSGDNEHIARSGKTVTGIAARFSDGDNALIVGAIFWLDGSSSASADLKRMWIFSQAPEQTLDSWLQAHEAGGSRALKQLEKEMPGLRMFTSKQSYLAQLRRFFEVGENAFTLLNRAAGMKQIDSIDEVFREFVLDDMSAFDKAAAVAKQFDDLAEIHRELEVARQQRASLLPVAETWKARGDLQAKDVVHRQLDALIAPWYALHTSRLLGERVIQLDRKLELAGAQLKQLQTKLAIAEREATTLRDVYLNAGGAGVDQLREQIDTQKNQISRLERHATDYRRLCGALTLNDALTPDALQENQLAAHEQVEIEKQTLHSSKQQVYEAGATRQGHQQARDELQRQREQVRARPGSNLPPAYVLFRSALAQQLRLTEDELPFVAELVEVKSEQARWRGAIERAIGGQRLRVMVPAAAMDDALAWINQRHNQLHVRLLEVRVPARAVEFFADGYTRKLNFKPHPHREVLKQLLAEHDLHCVDSPEQLRTTPHGLTEQGLMSGRKHYFDKHDQRRLDQDWMTGFDNKDRLAALDRDWQEADKLVCEADAAHEVAVGRAEQTEQRLALWKNMLPLRFEDIDLPGAKIGLESFELQFAALTAPDSDAAKAEARWRAADMQLRELRQQETQGGIEKGVLEGERKGAEKQRQRAVDRLGRPLSDEQCALAAEHLGAPDPERLDEFGDMERIASEAQRKRIESLGNQLKKCEQELVRQMGTTQKLDTGALSEVGSDMDDVPAYLERLRLLTNEALPEKQQRFLDYLNQSSDQGVTQLLSEIESEVAMIEERIDDLNSTLRRVDFAPGCYLSLQPQRVVHESLRHLTQAQRHLHSARLKDDGDCAWHRCRH